MVHYGLIKIIFMNMGNFAFSVRTALIETVLEFLWPVQHDVKFSYCLTKHVLWVLKRTVSMRRFF